jgi:hypothetical protein
VSITPFLGQTWAMTAMFLLGVSVGIAICAYVIFSVTSERLFEMNGVPDSPLKEADQNALEHWKSNSLTISAFFILVSLVLLGIVAFR